MKTEIREAVQARGHWEFDRIPSTLTIFRYLLHINCRLPNFGDKLITAAMQRLDDCLIATIVSYRLACIFESSTECCVGNNLTFSEVVQQFFPGNNSIPVFNQTNQQFEDYELY